MVGAQSQIFEEMGVTLMKFMNGVMTNKDVKNEDSSQWLIENKGARKVLPMVD